MMQSEDTVKKNGEEDEDKINKGNHISTHLEDTSQDVIAERCEVFQGVHHWNNEVVVPLDLRQHLSNHQTEWGIRYRRIWRV